MGAYINLGNNGFRRIRNSEYVDKSGLIAVVNNTLNSEFAFTCVSRCRRFGKSMAAKMLCAYYDKSCDSRSLFEDLEIAKDPSFEEHLNKYPVIYLDLTAFVSRIKDASIVEVIEDKIRSEIIETYPKVKDRIKDDYDLMDVLIQVNEKYGEQFIFIIDEWDAICREFKDNSRGMDRYVNWLRRMFKEVKAFDVFAGVYMTGILPIKKYKTQSALNNFIEYSMVTPGKMASFFGFTKDEVRMLADKHGMDFDELVKWYDGYQIGPELSMFNPNSVMQALSNSWCESYWAATATYDTVSDYIQMNYEGLKDDIINMLAGGRCGVDTKGFQNDMSIIRSKDDVLTVLIHLGYLSYDRYRRECYIPNREVEEEMVNAVKANNWAHVAEALTKSKQLLQATLDGDEEAVAEGLKRVHSENTSILSYNNENSLSCAINIAYYAAHNDYIFMRELPSGKGFADIVLIPRKNVDSPAIVIELKYNQDADTAIDQIRRKEYPESVRAYTNNILLVGINYDKKEKRHTCRIEAIRG